MCVGIYACLLHLRKGVSLVDYENTRREITKELYEIS